MTDTRHDPGRTSRRGEPRPPPRLPAHRRPLAGGGGRLLRLLAAALAGAALAGLAAGCATPGRPAAPGAGRADAAAEARHADLAMAAAVAAGDVEAFVGHVGSDGIFFGARGPSVGRGAVALAWAPFLAPEGPRLAWSPDRALAAPSGDLVFTFGPWTLTPAGGGQAATGRYLTAWRRDADGLLRVALDGADEPLPAVPPHATFHALRVLVSADGELLAEGGVIMDGGREAGWFMRLARRDGDGFARLAEAGGWRAAP